MSGTIAIMLGRMLNEMFLRRADYLDRGLTPHLLDIAKKGLRAKSMIPIFPVRFSGFHR